MTITLNNLAFGDVRELQTNLEVHKTINQQTILIRAANWFDTQVLTLEYINVSYSSTVAFIQFLKTNAAKSIHYKDHEGNRYTGFIITPVIEFQTYRRPQPDKPGCTNDKGTYSFKFQFAITGTY